MLGSSQVEPAERAYEELKVKAVITGRRGSQGGARSALRPLEIDSTGMLKLNPFYAWSFKQVHSYIEENSVPRNALLSQGYKSVGDWHSTAKSGEGDAGERAGRWQGKQKTECGLHKDFTQMKLKSQKRVGSDGYVRDPVTHASVQAREAGLRVRDESRGPETVSAITIVSSA